MATIIPKLPNCLSATDGEMIPDGLVNATILAFGTLDPAANVSGGGLVIDYRPEGSLESIRAILAFDETGMWIGSVGSIDASPTPDAPPE